MLLPLHAAAQCYDGGASERLQNYCATERLNRSYTDLNTLRFVDSRLKSEGFARGLGLPGTVSRHTNTAEFAPSLRFSENINGGNSSAPLVLGQSTLEAHPDTLRTSGIVAGGAIGTSGRYITGIGRYLDYSLNASYEHSPKYNYGISTLAVRGCSMNSLGKQFYFDLCGQSKKIDKVLSDDITSSFSGSFSHTFNSGENAFSEAGVGVTRYFSGEYVQNQFGLKWATIYESGLVTNFNIVFGEPVANNHAMRFYGSVELNKRFWGKPLSMTLGYIEADGGLLLGFERSDRTQFFSFRYPIADNISVEIGYTNTNSSISYFDVRSPSFGLNFAKLRF